MKQIQGKSFAHSTSLFSLLITLFLISAPFAIAAGDPVNPRDPVNFGSGNLGNDVNKKGLESQLGAKIGDLGTGDIGWVKPADSPKYGGDPGVNAANAAANNAKASSKDKKKTGGAYFKDGTCYLVFGWIGPITLTYVCPPEKKWVCQANDFNADGTPKKDSSGNHVTPVYGTVSAKSSQDCKDKAQALVDNPQAFDALANQQAEEAKAKLLGFCQYALDACKTRQANYCKNKNDPSGVNSINDKNCPVCEKPCSPPPAPREGDSEVPPKDTEKANSGDSCAFAKQYYLLICKPDETLTDASPSAGGKIDSATSSNIKGFSSYMNIDLQAGDGGHLGCKFCANADPSSLSGTAKDGRKASDAATALVNARIAAAPNKCSAKCVKKKSPSETLDKTANTGGSGGTGTAQTGGSNVNNQPVLAKDAPVVNTPDGSKGLPGDNFFKPVDDTPQPLDLGDPTDPLTGQVHLTSDSSIPDFAKMSNAQSQFQDGKVNCWAEVTYNPVTVGCKSPYNVPLTLTCPARPSESVLGTGLDLDACLADLIANIRGRMDKERAACSKKCTGSGILDDRFTQRTDSTQKTGSGSPDVIETGNSGDYLDDSSLPPVPEKTSILPPPVPDGAICYFASYTRQETPGFTAPPGATYNTCTTKDGIGGSIFGTQGVAYDPATCTLLG